MTDTDNWTLLREYLESIGWRALGHSIWEPSPPLDTVAVPAAWYFPDGEAYYYEREQTEPALVTTDENEAIAYAKAYLAPTKKKG